MIIENKIGLTMGDPSGVGPEIICKAISELPTIERSSIVIIGNIDFMRKANELLGQNLQFGSAFTDLPKDVIAVEHVPTEGSSEIVPGKITAAGGEAAFRYIVKAVELTKSNDINVIVTAPLNKGAMHLAGHEFDGHTGLLASLTNSPQSFMLLTSDILSTVHVSTHVSLSEAVTRCTTERVLATIKAGHQHMKEMGLDKPRIAVAGLNPHCGEGGIFGSEEIDHIIPAVEIAVKEGIDVTGPISGDTVFYRTVRNEFDLVISQYHDQGHAPSKLLAFDTTVNVSLGLPLRRTSVDHGTAFDIAWTGKADHQNMLCAISYAQRWSNNVA